VGTWLLLTYRVPRDPTSSRVYVWRKLKRLGALSLQDAVWVLPASAATRERFEWLASEIEELDGEVMLWEAKLAVDGREEAVTQTFISQAETGYRQIMDELKQPDPDLGGLSRRYQQVRAQDFFNCELGKQAREALVNAGANPGGGARQ
jgi:hypothetical protein